MTLNVQLGLVFKMTSIDHVIMNINVANVPNV